MKSIICSRFGQTLRLSKELKSMFTRSLSFGVEPLRNDDAPFRTLEVNPGEHKRSHIGLYYTIPHDFAMQTLFHLGGLPKPFKEQCQTFTETCLMVREPAVELIHFLKSADYSKPINKYVIYGKSGAGKSISVAHAIHYASMHDWLIVHVPFVNDWLRRSIIETANSATKPGYVDLPTKAQGWLHHFKTQNHKFLAGHDLRIQKEHVWNQREVSSPGDTFLQVIDHGINRVKYSSEVIVALLGEIKQHCRENKIKALVVVDGFGAFFHPQTRVVSEDKVKMPPWKVTFIEAFLDITKSDWHNGAAILVVDELSVAGHDASPLPLYLLTQKGFEHLDPFIPIHVPEMTLNEMFSMLRYYKDRMWLQNPNGDRELAFLCGGNPYRLMQLCSSL